jgi:hypothetical protein
VPSAQSIEIESICPPKPALLRVIFIEKSDVIRIQTRRGFSQVTGQF